MKTLKQITIVLLLAIYSVGLAQKTALNTIKIKYDNLLKEQLEGVAVLIKKDNKNYTLSLGNSNLDAAKVFNIGSATKTFTAILIMQEVEKGNLKLDDTIGQYLDTIKNVNPSLSIKTLLTHESGLANVIGQNIENMFYAKSDSIYNSVNLLNTVEVNNPDEIGKFNYCNTNYLLLGRILENINDQSYFDLLRTRIIEPLNLKNTHPYVSKNIPNLAIPFHKGKDVTKYLDYRYFATLANAAGSMASTLNDMEVFYTSLFETDKLLKKETVQEMMHSGNTYYGFGIMKDTFDGVEFYGHGGNNIGYSFRNGYNPKTKELFLMFSNNRKVPFYKMIQTDVFAFLADKTIATNQAVNMKVFKKYVGTFLLKEANMKMNIVLEENKLFLEVKAQGMKSELFQKDANTLIDASVGATLSIIDNNDDALTFSQNGFTTTLTRIK
jgi:CubicO group peptidase (beta-lactamase class C family)